MINSLVLAFVAQGNLVPVANLVLPPTVKPGATFKAKINLTFKPNLHGYQNPPSDPLEIPVKVQQKAGATKLISVQYPKGVPFGDPKVNVYSGTVTIGVTLKAAKTAGPLTLIVNYQQCTDTTCYPPAVLTIKGNVPVAK